MDFLLGVSLLGDSLDGPLGAVEELRVDAGKV
jgi:hypothetical protein